MLVPFPDLFVLSFYSQTLVGKAISVSVDVDPPSRRFDDLISDAKNSRAIIYSKRILKTNETNSIFVEE
jgi:hypothetical protein